jgi:hypothetical protein
MKMLLRGTKKSQVFFQALHHAFVQTKNACLPSMNFQKGLTSRYLPSLLIPSPTRRGEIKKGVKNEGASSLPRSSVNVFGKMGRQRGTRMYLSA